MSARTNAGGLSGFLQEVHINKKNAREVWVVMGNEAADLDSMASAVCLAWQLARKNRQAGTVFLPFIPILREDFRLRTEAAFLFSEAGLSETDLFFADDVNLEALGKNGTLRLVLVDHNKPGKAYAAYLPNVAGVVDHHQDEGLFPELKARNIEPVGSACTLVAEKILEDGMSDIPSDVAVLLAGTILLDTVNLDPAAGRVTPKDEAMVSALLPIAGKSQQVLFDRLQFEKFNVASLSTFDLLRKDYKEYTAGAVRYGMSSVLLSLESWKKKDSKLPEELKRYAESRKLSLLFVMNAYTEPKFTRELVVYSPDSALFKKIDGFLKATDLGLSTVPAPAGSTPDCSGWFAQANESYSRKKLQPIIQQFLES